MAPIRDCPYDASRQVIVCACDAEAGRALIDISQTVYKTTDPEKQEGTSSTFIVRNSVSSELALKVDTNLVT